MTRPSPGPSTPPPPPGPKAPARQISTVAAAADGPADFTLPKPPEFPEFCSGSAMYADGRWSA